MIRAIFLCVVVIALDGGDPVLSQQPPMRWSKDERPKVVVSDPITITNYSRSLRRYVSYRAILPRGYLNGGKKGDVKYPVVYLLHGLWGSYKNWTELTKLAEHAAGRDVIVVTAEGGDGWYVDSPVQANNNWESYFIKELIPEVEARYHVKADRSRRVVAGLSMGGYGSIKFGLKYPHLFGLIGSFSGCIDCANWTESNGGRIGKTVEAMMGPADTHFRRSNDIERLVKELPADKIKDLPFIYMACGENDQFVEHNRKFDALLTEKNIPHVYRKVPGTHSWAFWNEEVREFLTFVDRWKKT